MKSKNIFKNIHYCGKGFKGHLIETRGLKFCGLCGKEFKL